MTVWNFGTLRRAVDSASAYIDDKDAVEIVDGAGNKYGISQATIDMQLYEIRVERVAGE